MTMRLDTDLMRRRRMQLGLSQRAVARRLGVTSLTVGRIEDGGNHEVLSLRLLARLADALAVPATSLLVDTTTTAPSQPADTDHVRAAGALLASADAPVARATLADLLGVSPAQVDVVLAGLSAALEPAGLVLHVGPGGASIVPDASQQEPDLLRQLLAAQHATHGLTSRDATLLARAHAGTLDPTRLGNADLVALARLHNAGLLDDDHQLTADVVYSVGLT